jgi:hypothetical protein
MIHELSTDNQDGAVPLLSKPEPWSPRDATVNISHIANCPDFSLIYKQHAKERMLERDLIQSDVLHVLKRGQVLIKAQRANKTPGYFKYGIECSTPNSNGRTVKLIVIPSASVKKIKIITVMWKDESQTRAGTLMEGST